MIVSILDAFIAHKTSKDCMVEGLEKERERDRERVTERGTAATIYYP